MVRRNFSERCQCRPVKYPLQALKEYCNIQAREITIHLDSGVVLQATKTNPEPREVHNEDPLACRRSRSSVDAIEGPLCHVYARSLAECANVQTCEIRYRLDSGAWFQATKTNREPREIHEEDPLDCRSSRLSEDAVEGSDDVGTASKNGRARGLPAGGRHGQAMKRKRRDGSCPCSASRKKRRSTVNLRVAPKSDYQCEDEDATEEFIGGETELRLVRVDDLLDYFDKALRSLNQLCCRDLGKEWIGYCHPKKQSKHPYNGGELGERSSAEYGVKNKGQLSKPDYWPSDHDSEGKLVVPHKEPDHLIKSERLQLLLHLLHSEGKGYMHGDFRLEELKKATVGIERRRGERWTAANLQRLQEIYRVRAKEIEYEKGMIDGDTMVSVQMPEPRSKSRKARKSAIKAAKSYSMAVREKPTNPEQRNSSLCNAPVATMCIDLQTEDERQDPSEGSERWSRADTAPSTEEVGPDVSCPGPISCKGRTVQYMSPSFDSPGSKDRGHDSVQEDWTLPFANIPQSPAITTHPSPYSSVMTPGEAQRSLPLRGQYHCGSSSMQNFSSQVPRGQNKHRSTARPPGADQIVDCSPPARPVAPKVENARYPLFAGSSSGLVGVPPADTDYSGWRIEDHRSPQVEPSIFTAVDDPSASLLASTNGSFSSGYSGANTFSAPQLVSFDDGGRTMMQPYYQSLDEDSQRYYDTQAVGIPHYFYQRLDLDTPPGSNPDWHTGL